MKGVPLVMMFIDPDSPVKNIENNVIFVMTPVLFLQLIWLGAKKLPKLAIR